MSAQNIMTMFLHSSSFSAGILLFTDSKITQEEVLVLLMANIPQPWVMTYSGDAGERKRRTQPWLKAYYCGNLGTHCFNGLNEVRTDAAEDTSAALFNSFSCINKTKKKRRSPHWCAQSTNQLALTTASSTVFMIRGKTFLRVGHLKRCWNCICIVM